MQLKLLERRIDRNLDIKNSSDQTIPCDSDKPFIVKVDKKDCFKIDYPIERYLPHNPVFHPLKPGKARRLLNGAAKFHGSSLKNALLTGPDLLQILIQVLNRIRQYQYVVSADIKGMFLQVGIIPQDQSSIRFVAWGPIRGNCFVPIRASHFWS